MMVSFGNASGPVPAFELSELAKRGSLFITRPTLFTYVANREDLLTMSAELFEMVANGAIAEADNKGDDNAILLSGESQRRRG